MKVHFFDIVWDMEGEEVDLPSSVTLEVESDNLEEDAADILSDKYGWCVISLNYKLLD